MKITIFDMALVAGVFLIEDVRWQVVSLLQSMDVSVLIVLLIGLAYTQRSVFGLGGAKPAAHGGH